MRTASFSFAVYADAKWATPLATSVSEPWPVYVFVAVITTGKLHFHFDSQSCCVHCSLSLHSLRCHKMDWMMREKERATELWLLEMDARKIAMPIQCPSPHHVLNIIYIWMPLNIMPNYNNNPSSVIIHR